MDVILNFDKKETTMVLQNIFYVSNMKKNLISVSYFIKNEHSMNFNNFESFIDVKKKGKEFISITILEKLYCIKIIKERKSKFKKIEVFITKNRNGLQL